MEFSTEEKTTPNHRTMSEIEWDDTEHRFAGAKTKGGEEVVMLERRWVDGYPDLHVIMCVDLEGHVGTWIPGHITPTGRRFRLEPTGSVPKGGPIETEFDPAYTYSDNHGDKWKLATKVGRWVCETRKGHTFNVEHDPPAEYGPYTRIEDTK